MPIKNEELFVDAGQSGAAYLYFLTPGSGLLDKASWDEKRFGMFCMSYESWGDIKAELEKLCSRPGGCSWETQAAMKSFFNRAEAVRASILEMR